MRTTRAWKVFGLFDGEKWHDQKESFNNSRKFTTWAGEDFIILNSDITGTNEYTLVIVTADTEFGCEKALDGQLSDGVFENYKASAPSEVDAQEVLKKYNEQINLL